MDYGYELGLIDKNIYHRFESKKKYIDDYLHELKKIKLDPKDINPVLEQRNTSSINEKESVNSSSPDESESNTHNHKDNDSK